MVYLGLIHSRTRPLREFLLVGVPGHFILGMWFWVFGRSEEKVCVNSRC